MPTNTLNPIYAGRTYTEYMTYNAYNLSRTPSVGNAKILVIPIWLTDSKNYIAVENKDTIRNDIANAYFGTNEETGWRSVKSYYEEESQGRLTLDGTVSEWYTDTNSSSTYGPESSGLQKTTELVSKATKWYFDNHGSESKRDYDCDGDGYLDGVMLIYGAPNYSHLTNGNSKKNLWAYCYWLQDTSVKNRFNPGANAFFWASFDFMFGSNIMASHCGISSSYKYASGDTAHMNIDAHTFIHEMGHMFGLNDYYDYSGQYVPAGGFSMQDQNVGGHDPFSSFALGWGQAYVPTESVTIYLKPFTQSGEMIILSPSWNSYNSAFDEYLVLEYYTADGLNDLDSTYNYCNVSPTGSRQSGIRLWHVDARLAVFKGYDTSGDPIFEYANTTNPSSAAGGVTLLMSNTYEGDYADYHQLQLIRNKKTTSYNSQTKFKAEHLFKQYDTFTMSDYSKQFVNSTKLNNNKSLGYSFTVETIRDEYAQITITKA